MCMTANEAIKERGCNMSVDLGVVRTLGAEAVGQPGQRRFRLFVRNKHESAVMWMEKEQLNSLALTIDRFLAQLTAGQVLRIEAQVGGFHASSTLPADFPNVPDYELQVGRFILGDRKSTRLNSSHPSISYAVFCLKKK